MGRKVPQSTNTEISPYKKLFSSCTWWEKNGKTNFGSIIRAIKGGRPKGRDPENLYKLRLLIARGLGVKTTHIRIIPTIGTPLEQKGVVAQIEISKPKRMTLVVKNHIPKNGANRREVFLDYRDLDKERASRIIVEKLKVKIFGPRKARHYKNFLGRRVPTTHPVPC